VQNPCKNHEADMSESLIGEFERRLAKCRDEAASGLGTEMSKWYPWLIDNGPKIVEMAPSRPLSTENKALRACAGGEI